MQARLKPCAKRENSNHRARTSEGCFFFLHRAQPVSEMEQSGIELHGASRMADRIQSIYFEKIAKNLDCIPVIYFKITP